MDGNGANDLGGKSLVTALVVGGVVPVKQIGQPDDQAVADVMDEVGGFSLSPKNRLFLQEPRSQRDFRLSLEDGGDHGAVVVRVVFQIRVLDQKDVASGDF